MAGVSFPEQQRTGAGDKPQAKSGEKTGEMRPNVDALRASAVEREHRESGGEWRED